MSGYAFGSILSAKLVEYGTAKTLSSLSDVPQAHDVEFAQSDEAARPINVR